MSKWTMTKLGDVLRRNEQTVQILPDVSYREIVVRWWGKGVTLRRELAGVEIASSRRFLARGGQFILSRIDARKGAIAIVPTAMDGAIVTNDFPVYDCNTRVLIPAYLGWLSRTASFVENCERASEGTTNRVRLKEPKFLSIEFPLPPLSEQRRLVARIEEASAQIQQARALRQETVEEGIALLTAMAHRADLDDRSKKASGWRRKRLSDVVNLVDDSHKVEPDECYPNLGIYSFGRGLFPKPPIHGLATSAKTLRRVKAGQFIYSRLFAFEGAYGRVTPEFDGMFVSKEYPTFQCDEGQVLSEFLAAYFLPQSVWKAVAACSKGLGDRRQRVQPVQLLAHELWIPPVSWQNRLREVQTKVDALKRLQAETSSELDALLPAILDRAFNGEL